MLCFVWYKVKMVIRCSNVVYWRFCTFCCHISLSLSWAWSSAWYLGPLFNDIHDFFYFIKVALRLHNFDHVVKVESLNLRFFLIIWWCYLLLFSNLIIVFWCGMCCLFFLFFKHHVGCRLRLLMLNIFLALLAAEHRSNGKELGLLFIELHDVEPGIASLTAGAYLGDPVLLVIHLVAIAFFLGSGDWQSLRSPLVNYVTGLRWQCILIRVELLTVTRFFMLIPWWLLIHDEIRVFGKQLLDQKLFLKGFRRHSYRILEIAFGSIAYLMTIDGPTFVLACHIVQATLSWVLLERDVQIWLAFSSHRVVHLIELVWFGHC